MSINALEKALWQIYQVPSDTRRFTDNAQAFVHEFRLDDSERAMLASFDFMAMISHGANPLLVMMAFQTTQGMGRFPEYWATVNQSRGETQAS